MPKLSTVYTCSKCHATSPKWSGKCDQCGSWNTFVESTSNRPSFKQSPVTASSISALDAKSRDRASSGIADVDEILGGGIVPGSIILLAGDPGVGKSTLALQLAGAATGRVLYVSGEESASQIKYRADRLATQLPNVELLTEATAESVSQILRRSEYALAIIDSIQTVPSEDHPAQTGSIGQITAASLTIQQAAKSSQTAVLLIGHVTKDGAIAGPKVLEHLVDVVLYLEGERQGHYKILRATKNRFGQTGHSAILEMHQSGMRPAVDPSAAMLAERQATAGSIVYAAIEGSRPILVEVQALVSPTPFGYPRRTSAGVDLNRVNLLLAVLERHAGINLRANDVYVNIVGGLKTTEPAVDLAIILSIASAFHNRPVKGDLAAFGEVGLAGEIRAASMADKRLSEAAKYGFTRAIGPLPATKNILGVSNVKQAIQTAFES